MKPTLGGDAMAALERRVEIIAAEVAARYPGEPEGRQPVHTVYGGAHLFRADTAARLGARARAGLDAYAPDAATFAAAIGLVDDEELADTVYRRVRRKLEREPVEDFRIDFEDGYGNRPDDEEDACAVEAGSQVAAGLAAGSLPPFVGIRVKPLTVELQRRSARTLDLFLTALLEANGGALPEGFLLTLPKVVDRRQVEAFVDLLDRLESRLGLESGALRIELMVETTQSLLDAAGSSALPGLVQAAAGRCTGAHFGVYDYTAAVGITAQYQTLDHPACDHARHAMQVALAGSGVMLSDGATNVIPNVPHRAADGVALSEEQQAENRQVFHAAWRLHYEHVRHSLRHAYYQGWDLNPAQLPTRYGAVYAFYLESLEAATERLANFVGVAAQATLVGDVFDDAATGQGLLNFFLRGLGCGALNEAEALATGLSLDELRSRSFVQIIAGRAARDAGAAAPR